MAKLTAHMPKCISSYGVIKDHASIWICRAFVTSTRPCEKQYLDKETCEKVKEAAVAVTEGIKEARQTGQFVKETITTNAGTVVTEMAKKALEKASEDGEDEEKEGKSAWQKVKEVVKGKDK
ncbi:OLC1v1019386C1 [Oldenlandia corymbosa var. corymbosa]|uniref:OLC1v1019386C1 n=1 Tax=Oldenlandia corymbosa var. corymbosa TaxID=529605 RepID=A0AAV1EDU3_OLDCO|nr:OLC1v1019386C1 [Oldenlandia corymbosa var. corymbosa]